MIRKWQGTDTLQPRNVVRRNRGKFNFIRMVIVESEHGNGQAVKNACDYHIKLFINRKEVINLAA